MKNNAKETTNPPLPHLGVPTGAGGLWEPAQDQTYFTVRFHPSLKDHKRCLWRILYIGQNFAIHYAAAISILFLFVLAGFFLVESWCAGKWIKLMPSLAMRAALQTLGCCLLGPMTRRIVINEQIKKLSRHRHPLAH